MILIALLILLLVLLYIKVIKPYSYWSDRGVKQRKQVYLLGDNAGLLLRKESFFDMIINIYKAFPDERYCGMYQLILPTLLIRDPELIKQITVKDFDHFVDHRKFVADDGDPLWPKTLIALRGKQWRNMRSRVSPTFTSSKMKTIFGLITECADIYMNYFKKTNEVATIELKDVFTRFTSDIIATVAFGVTCDSINDKENIFYMMGRRATVFKFSRYLIFFAHTISPKLCQVFGIKIFPASVTEFLQNLVKDTIRLREEQGLIRPDLIHLLLEARKSKKKFDEEKPALDASFAAVEEIHKADANIKPIEITDNDIAAQAVVFFIAGFESVATLMSFMGYELTANPEIQERLQQEIDETMKECDGKLTYEALMKMKYMDMVTSETFRKWPTVIGGDRVCTKAYTIQPKSPGEKSLHLQPGDIIWLPINAIHHDPKYWPNPEKFDPERFNDENKDNIKPYTYLPFGTGPRNCIGSRFALLEIKAIMFYILHNFNLVVTEKTDIPLKISKTYLNLSAENGIWVGLKPRNK